MRSQKTEKMAATDIDDDRESNARLYTWFNRAAEASNLVKPLSDAEYQSVIWVDRYSQTQPAWIAHKNFGPCLIYAKREDDTAFLGAKRTYYLVALVTAVEDRALAESRRGYFQVPAVVSIEDKNGDAQIMPFVFPLRCIITKFVLATPQESSMVTVYDSKEYTTMMLSELRRRAGKPNNEEAYTIAFDAFKQSNPSFLLKHDITAAATTTPAADARLIMSALSRHEHDMDVRYALAPPFLRHVLKRKDERKGRAHIDARCAHPMYDPHGVISHLRKQ